MDEKQVTFHKSMDLLISSILNIIIIIIIIPRARILKTCHLSFLARYINLGYGAQAPKIVIL